MLSVTSLFLLSLGAACLGAAAPPRESRIVGGVSTTIRTYPYQVSIQYNDVHACGGSIISREWILTSAACIKQGTGKLTVRVGATNHNSGGTVCNAVYVVYSSTSVSAEIDNGPALIQLSEPLTYDTTIGPIKLPEENATVKGGVSGVITGWGTTSSATVSTSLQRVSLTTVTWENCVEYYSSDFITDKVICARASLSGTCNGDEGGPFVVGLEQVGIAQGTTGCGRPNNPSVFILVSPIRSWIRIHAGV